MPASPHPPPPLPDTHINPTTSLTYWSTTPATISGMLGGYPQVSTIDLRSSYAFVTKLLRLHPPPRAPSTPRVGTRSRSRNEETNGREGEGGVEEAETEEEEEEETGEEEEEEEEEEEAQRLPFRRALDCGAGIGRVTGGVLSRVSGVTDAVEPIAAFSSQIGSTALCGPGRVGAVYTTGLESFRPCAQGRSSETQHGIYDLIWIQWCIGHLTDAQFHRFLQSCKTWLAPGGWLVVKENMSTSKAVVEGRVQVVDVYDEVDSSVTRGDAAFRRVFEGAGWRVERTEVQRGFEGVARGLLPVRVYALRPEVRG